MIFVLTKHNLVHDSVFKHLHPTSLYATVQPHHKEKGIDINIINVITQYYLWKRHRTLGITNSGVHVWYFMKVQNWSNFSMKITGDGATNTRLQLTHKCN